MQSPTAAVVATAGAVDDGEPSPWEAAKAVNTKIPPSTTMTSSHGTARKITVQTPASGATSTSPPWNRGRAAGPRWRAGRRARRAGAPAPGSRPVAALARTSASSRS